jgi:flagellar biosynthetic protein FliR
MKGITHLASELQQWATVLMLVIARIAPVIQLVPYLGGKATPQSVKTALALALSLLLVPIMRPEIVPHGPMLAVLVFKEVAVGLTLGFVGALVFEATRTAGQVMDTVRGQNMATALVPQLPERSSVSADLLYLLFVAVFLSSGAHHLLLRAWVRSYEAVPLAGFPDLDRLVDLGMLMARLFGASFELALVIAMPVVLASLLADALLALINRAAPQVQVFFIGMPIKAALGIFVLLVTVEVTIEVLLAHGAHDLQVLQEVFRE